MQSRERPLRVATVGRGRLGRDLVAAVSLLRDDSLDDDVDLDALFSLALEQVVQTVALIAWAAKIQLWRDPPVVNVNFVLRHVDRSAKVPKVVALGSVRTARNSLHQQAIARQRSFGQGQTSQTDCDRAMGSS